MIADTAKHVHQMDTQVWQHRFNFHQRTRPRGPMVRAPDFGHTGFKILWRLQVRILPWSIYCMSWTTMSDDSFFANSNNPVPVIRSINYPVEGTYTFVLCWSQCHAPSLCTFKDSFLILQHSLCQLETTKTRNALPLSQRPTLTNTTSANFVNLCLTGRLGRELRDISE